MLEVASSGPTIKGQSRANFEVRSICLVLICSHCALQIVQLRILNCFLQLPVSLETQQDLEHSLCEKRLVATQVLLVM